MNWLRSWMRLLPPAPLWRWCMLVLLLVGLGGGSAFAAQPSLGVNISVTIAPGPPVVDLNGIAGGIDTSAIFTESGGAVAIVNATGLTVIDPYGSPLSGATVTISNLLDGTNEVLAVTDSGGITSSYNAGVLTLSGVASASAYQTVLRTLTYNNLSTNPTTTARVVTVTASDGALTSVVATSTVTVFSRNNTPVINAIANQTILEDSGVLSVALAGINNGGDSPQVITVTASSSNTTLLLDPTVVYTSASTTGTLLLAANPHQFGVATVTVTVRDDGGTAFGSVDFTTRTFTVTVTPVNDRPTLSAISDVTITENSPAQLVALAGITVGPANEVGQVLTVTAISSRPDIIPNPTVIYTSAQSTGVLSFTPVTNMSGTATILVSVRDDGGTANGGQNTFSRTFTVTVTPVPHIPVLIHNTGFTVPVNGTGVVSYLTLEVADQLDPALMTYTVVTAPTAGTLFRNSVALAATNTFTQDDINAGLLIYTHTSGIAGTDSFAVTVLNSEGRTLPLITFPITITGAPAGTIPVVTLPGGTVTWVQGAGTILLDTTATVTDTSGTLSGGTLSVTLIAGSTVQDVLSVRNVGSGIGQIGVAGVVVSYEGTQIGTLSGGSGGTPLTIALNIAAVPAAVEALLRSVTFTNGSAAPGTVTRRAQVLLTNGGTPIGVSAPVAKDIIMQAVNQAPVVTLPVGSVAYPEASGALVLDPTATFIDVDSPSLVGGAITATWISNGSVDDQLWVRNEGSGANQISVTGNVVSYNGAVIGFLSGGVNGSALTMTLTNLATPTSAQALLMNLTYNNPSALPSVAPRQLSVVATDGNGGTSAAALLTVVVQAVQDPPIITLPSPATIYVQGVGALAIDPAATVTDADTAAFTTGVLVVDFTAGASSADRLLIQSQGSGAGQIDQVGTDVRYGGVIIGTVTGPGTDTNPLLVVLNNQATVAATQALLRRVAFRNDAAPPVGGARTVRVTVTDGTGATSAPATTTITVQTVNSPPIVTLPGGGVTWSEGAVPIDVAPAGTITDGDSVNFLNGNLTINITDALGGEIISLRNDGNGVGQIGLSAATVSYGGVAIGTLSGGSASTPLILAFTSTNATPAAAQAALRALQFMRSGQLLSATTRTIQVVANDGQDASVAVTTTVTLTPVDDPPQATASMLVTVTDVPAEGILIGSDPENAALTWQIVTAPATGTLTLLNAATGAVRYDPAAGATGDILFTARVSDGTTWSSPATITIRITDRLAAVRPLILSAPPHEGVLGAPLTYQITTQLGALPSGRDRHQNQRYFRHHHLDRHRHAPTTPTNWTHRQRPRHRHQQLSSDPSPLANHRTGRAWVSG
jgi:Cadherin-like/Bacterial Ig domain